MHTGGFSLIRLFTSFAMLGAEWVMWVLVALSVASVAVMLERAWYYRSLDDDLEKLSDEVRALLRKGDLAGAKARLEKSSSPASAVPLAGLAEFDSGLKSAEEAMARATGAGGVGSAAGGGGSGATGGGGGGGASSSTSDTMGARGTSAFARRPSPTSPSANSAWSATAPTSAVDSTRGGSSRATTARRRAGSTAALTARPPRRPGSASGWQTSSRPRGARGR